MNLHRTRILGIVLALLPFGLNASAAELRIVCGVAPYENVFKRIKDKYEQSTGNKIVFIGDINKNGADNSFKKVLAGEADIGSAAGTYEGWVKLIKEKNIADDAKIREFTQRVIGKDILKVFAHKDVGVENLSMEQVKNLFTGEIKNWNEVGGTKTPVVVVLQTTYPATNNFFKSKAMANRDFASTAVYGIGVQEMVEKVSGTPGGIGFVSNQIPSPGAIELKTGEVIGRPVVAIVHGKPSSLIMSLFDFISKEMK